MHFPCFGTCWIFIPSDFFNLLSAWWENHQQSQTPQVLHLKCRRAWTDFPTTGQWLQSIYLLFTNRFLCSPNQPHGSAIKLRSGSLICYFPDELEHWHELWLRVGGIVQNQMQYHRRRPRLCHMHPVNTKLLYLLWFFFYIYISRKIWKCNVFLCVLSLKNILRIFVWGPVSLQLWPHLSQWCHGINFTESTPAPN